MQKRQEQAQQLHRENTAVLSELLPKLTQRQQLVEEHARLDTLYRMASGNVSGARMDLETYVQRYYLEKILQSANRRFYEMSAGQFELRMYELEKAGEGKNRGLDLMVYSNVTGKERECAHFQAENLSWQLCRLHLEWRTRFRSVRLRSGWI